MQQLRDWFPAITGMACLALGAGMIGVFGFFIDPLSKEFGVGAATISFAPVALLLVPGLMGPIVGRLVDKLPIRRIMLAGVTVGMLGLLLSSVANSLVLAGLGFVGFSLGLSMYGPVVVNGLLVKIYPGREARALALAAMGISFATAILPPLVGLLLALFDWRITLATLALSILAALWILIPAGIPADAGAPTPVEKSTERESSIYREPAFWLVGLSVAMALNVAIVLAISYPPHFISKGFTATQAGFFIAIAGLSGLIGKTLIAVFSDFVGRHTRWVAVALLSVQVLGLCALPYAESAAATAGILMLLGIGSGGFLPMHPYLNSRYFHANVIGQVNGAQMPLFLPFGMVGAPLAGYMYDQQGDYHAVMFGLAAALAIAVLLTLMLPRANPALHDAG